MVEVAVVGAAGYTGIEAVRWILGHPRLSLACATSGADAGKKLAEVYPALRGATDLEFSAPDAAAIAESAKVAILAVPHTAALELAPQLLDAGLTVIDLSADFRLKSADVYQQWYGVEHTAPNLLAEAVYGLPELDRSKLAGARLVAGPGCYPTATTLAALPALEAGVASGSRAIVDAKSGVSGAGRSASAATHFCTVNESMAAYKVASHRHTPEIEQNLSFAAGRDVAVTFTPHLIPLTRGLLSTVYLEVEEHFTTAEAVELYRGRYHAEPFVTVHATGTMPTTAEVRGTNRAAIGVAVDERTNTLIATCTIDNLGKGAASQGIQCLNAVLGFPETEGLDAVGAVV
ncbi:MAG TPA: N-acetyl-gamma-glutamyl-phosphate reductase [Coriobacteriia bacterium]|nr:N-acetyl-gamma-glutamyl-phosphate reductase [Coriobacteriia bacterium]